MRGRTAWSRCARDREREEGGGHKVDGGRLRDKRRKIQKEKDEVLKREERAREKKYRERQREGAKGRAGGRRAR